MLKEFGTLPSIKLTERHRLPECSAIYFAIAREQILYVGLATNLRNRWQNHHRLPQLEAVDRKCEVKLFWLSCTPSQLNDLERQYIEHYCPTLNQTKVPDRQIVPSFQMLVLSLKKLNERVIGLGVCPTENQKLKTVVLGYLTYFEKGITTNIRKSLKAINTKPNSLFKWTETLRRQEGARWRTRFNGIEIQIVPIFEKRIAHNPSLYEVMGEKHFGRNWTSVPLTEYDAMRKEVKAMSFRERLELARSSEIGWQLFPWECGAQYRTVSGIEIMCLTSSQLEALFSKHPYLEERYPKMYAIKDDPIPKLIF